MTLRVDNCLTRAGFSLGLGDQWPSEVSGLDLCNEVGGWLYGTHRWKFLERRSAFLNLRGKITFTGASSSTVTLTSTGSFTNYTFLDGDRVEITSASGITTGFYDVASKTDSNVIVLKTSPGTTGTSVAGTMRLDTVALPSDFGEMQAGHAINADNNSISTMIPTTRAEIEQLNSSPTDGTSAWPYRYAVGYNSAGAPILVIYPTPTSNEDSFFRIIYRAKWDPLTKDTDTVDIPAWMEGLFLIACTEWARGLIEEDSAPVDVRMERVRASTLFDTAMRQDGRVQNSYGHLRGGFVRRSSRSWPHGYLDTEVSAPS